MSIGSPEGAQNRNSTLSRVSIVRTKILELTLVSFFVFSYFYLG